MDIVIDIQGFRDSEGKFIPKEIAVVALDAAIIGHWITLPPCSFEELPESSRRENNWLSQNYHGIEWFDGEANPKFFVSQLRDITRWARCIFTRGHEKASYLRDLLSRNIYNLEADSPAYKYLPDVDEYGHRCTHHGLRANAKFHCALRNAHKLKHWLNVPSSRNSGHASLSTNDDVVDEEKEKEEEGEIVQNVEVKVEDPTTDEEKENERTAKENPEITQTIPLSRSSPSYEFTGNFTCVATTECQVCRRLSCRQTTEGVDEIDSNRR